MAHVGQFFPVLFRRDFNLNVLTNRAGFARRYIATSNFVATGIGAILSGQQFDCGPDTQFDPRTIIWESDLMRLGLFFYRCTLLAQITTDSTYIKQTIYNVQGHGDILILQWQLQDFLRSPGFGLDFTGRILFFSPDWFDSFSSQPSCDAAPKLWSDGPPH